MPVLLLEPYLFPPDVFEQFQTRQDTTERWWVLHTRARAEKVLARNLLKNEIRFFLPLYTRKRPIRGRMVTSHLPLFTGYVFLFGDDQARRHALKTNAVAQSISVSDQSHFHADLMRIHQLMTSGALLAPVERLRPGSWVEITAGPLAGLEGKVIRRGRRLKFVIEVHFLQRGASVEIDQWMIEPR